MCKWESWFVYCLGRKANSVPYIFADISDTLFFLVQFSIADRTGWKKKSIYLKCNSEDPHSRINNMAKKAKAKKSQKSEEKSEVRASSLARQLQTWLTKSFEDC